MFKWFWTIFSLGAPDVSILDLDPSMSAEDINLLVGEGMRSKELSPSC